MTTTPDAPLSRRRPRVLIADDHAPTRALLREALEADGLEVCGEAADAAAAIRAVEIDQPDIALLEVHIPGSGIRAAATIAGSSPATRVVMLTVAPDDEEMFTCLQAGARGYLVKNMDLGRLSDALRGVLVGEAALTRELAAHVIEKFRTRDRRSVLGSTGQRGERLTKREWDVLELLEQDLTTAEIADRLFVAEVTVRGHIAATIRKLGVADRAAAIHLFRTGDPAI